LWESGRSSSNDVVFLLAHKFFREFQKGGEEWVVVAFGVEGQNIAVESGSAPDTAVVVGSMKDVFCRKSTGAMRDKLYPQYTEPVGDLAV